MIHLAPVEWQTLYKKHHVQGLRLANSILHGSGVRETADVAKDVVQEAWTVAWLHGTTEEHCRALFFRSIRLRAIDAARKVNVRMSAVEALQTGAGGGVLPGWGAAANPTMLRAVDIMSCNTFDTWYLKDVEGHTLEEVKNELDISYTALNSRLARARNLMKEEEHAHLDRHTKRSAED